MGVRRIQTLQPIVMTALLALQIPVQAQLAGQSAPPDMSKSGCQLVRVSGAVRAPADFKLERPARLVELIELAGGLDAKVGKTIQVTHGGTESPCSVSELNQEMKSELSEHFDLGEVMRGEEKANPFMKAGDIVVVYGPDVVYVTGNVKEPKGVLLTDGLTLKQAVLLAGGPSRNSKRIRVRVLGTAEQTKLKFALSLKTIGTRDFGDPLLNAYDIIEVSDENGSFGHARPINLRILLPTLSVKVVR
jgi:protein involved in polysaccharide export with SLBB domain